MLLPETAGVEGRPDPTWSPSVPLRCATRNESWGVAAWLARSGLISQEHEARIAPAVNSAFDMKGLWLQRSERMDLLRVLRAELEGRAVGVAERLDAELRKYAQHYLLRNEQHSRCDEP